MAESQQRIAEIRARVDLAKAAIEKGVRLDGNKLVVALTFVDDTDLANHYLQAVADINSLLCILDGGTPI